MFRCQQWAVKKNPHSAPVSVGRSGFHGGFICGERSFPSRFAKISFGGGFSEIVCLDLQVYSRTRMRPSSKWISSGFHAWLWSNQSGSGSGWIPGTVEPVEVGFVVGDPFLDRLPRWFDRLHGLDVEGRRWWARKLDNAFPEAVEPEEKFDLLGALDGPGEFHGSFAARAFEWVGTPDLENEVAPQRSHGAGGLLRWGRDEEDFCGWLFPAEDRCSADG